MVKKGSLFIIGNDGSYLDSQRGTLRALDSNTSVIQVLAPFDINTVVEVSYLLYGASNETVPQYLASTSYKGSDVLASTHALYSTVADWVLWEAPVTQRALAKISKYKSGQVGVSFSFKERYAPQSALSYKGVFGLFASLPASSGVAGDYYLCDKYNHTDQAIVWTKNDYAVWSGTAWTKPAQYLLLQNTSTVNMSVSASMLAAVAETISEDDEFALLFADVQGDVNDFKSGDQVVAEATKATNDGDDNVITSTYETKTDATAHKNRTDNPHVVTKSQVGLGNVDNTSDVNKPVSTAQQDALDLKVDKTFSLIGLTFASDIDLTTFKTALGNATQSLAGLMSDTDKTRLDALYALMADDDVDSIVNTVAEVLQVMQQYPEGVTIVDALASKVDKVTGYSLVDDNLISKLNALYTKGEIDTLLGNKVDKNISTYIELIASTADGDEELYVYDNGVPKKITLTEIYTGANTATGSFVSSGDYSGDGLGSFKTASTKIYTLTLQSSGDYRTTIRIPETDTFVWVKFPDTSANANLLRVSLNNGTNYYNVIKNGARFKASIVSGQLVRLQFDGTQFIADIHNDVTVTETYGETIESTYGLFNPQFEGIPLVKEIQGFTLSSSNVFVLTTGTTNGVTYTVSGNQITLSGTASAETTLTLASGLTAGNKAYVNLDYISGTSTGIITLKNDATSLNATYNADYSGVVTLGTTTITLVIANGAVLTNVIYKANINRTTQLISNKQYSPMFNTTFDLMTDANIKLQMDAWVQEGVLPYDGVQHVENTQLKSVGKNLFDKNISKTLGFAIAIETGIAYASATSFYTDYFRCQPNTAYTRTLGRWVSFYDSNQNYISSSSSITFTTPLNTTYIRLTGNISELDTTQLEQGTVATTYAPYNTETQKFNHGRLSKLPNGVADKIRLLNGAYVLDRYVQEYTLLSGDIDAITTGTNLQYVTIGIGALSGLITQTASAIDNEMFISGYREVATIDVSGESYTFVTDTTNLYIQVPLGTYASLGDAQTALAGTKIWYQLATPLLATETIDVDGVLLQDTVTTVQQLQDLPTTYLLEYAMNTDQTTATLVQRDKVQQLEIDSLETRTTALEARKETNKEIIFMSATDWATYTRVDGEVYGVWDETTGVITFYYGTVGE